MEYLDLHGMSVIEAKVFLNNYLAKAKGPKSIMIIHGYRQGSALQQFVRKQYNHPKIARKFIMLNPGETEFVLK